MATSDHSSEAINVEGLQTSLQTMFNKGIGNVGVCSTASSTATKKVTLGTTFDLVTGAIVIVRFSNAITVAGATLEVTHTTLSGTTTTEAAKSIYYRGEALVKDLIAANDTLILRYNGTQFDIIGQLDTNTPISVINNGPTLAWNTESTIGSVQGVDLKVTMPSNPNTTYKFTIGSTTKGDSVNGVDLGTLKSESAAAGGTTLSLVTTGEKETWNNKSDLTIGSTATTAAAGDHVHNTSIEESSQTNQLTLDFGKKYAITAGGTSYVFSTPSSPTDTKNTAGTTDNASKKMFLVGAESQAANPQTYSNADCYIGTDNCLYSGGTKVLTSHQSLDGKQDVINDLKIIGCGYFTCTTDGAITAKTITQSGYILKTNCIISVLFTNAFTAQSPTLNINSTGAKPIKCYGLDIPCYVVKNNTIVTMIYDGNGYNVVDVYHKETNPDLFVDLGFPSGVKWARKNVDLTQEDKFAVSEFQYECSFFSWGNTDGHEPISSSEFSYDFSASTYSSTAGNSLIGNIPLSVDAARVNLGDKWRLPSLNEINYLVDNTEFVEADGETPIPESTRTKSVTVNGISGIYLRSKWNGETIFFPLCGNANGTIWSNKGGMGFFWASTIGDDSSEGNMIYAHTNGFQSFSLSRYYGCCIRPVQ